MADMPDRAYSAHAPASIPLPALALVLALLAIRLAGCGSSGEELTAKSAAAILAAATTAARSASSAHVLDKDSDGRLTLELQLTHNGGRGRLSLQGHDSEVIRIGNTVFVKGGPAFDRRLAQRTGTRIPQGTWLTAPADGPQLADFAALTDPNGELSLLLRKPTISLAKGTTTTIDGQEAVELKEKGKLYTGAIYIATTGSPYPIKIIKHGRETSTTTFSSWNQPITLSAPAHTVALSKLEHGRRR
jgi:hypothetical protein